MRPTTNETFVQRVCLPSNPDKELAFWSYLIYIANGVLGL